MTPLSLMLFSAVVIIRSINVDEWEVSLMEDFIIWDAPSVLQISLIKEDNALFLCILQFMSPKISISFMGLDSFCSSMLS